MAYLVNSQTNAKQHLLSHHTFGRRSEAVDTCIGRPEVSKIHAAIEWANQEWRIRSFGRNGTWLDDQKLAPACNYALKVGQTIRFADLHCEGWIIADLSPPQDHTECEPQTTELQSPAFKPEQCTFKFEVSLDEEFVRLTLDHPDHSVELGGHTHHYLLLHLARIKGQHAKEGLHPRDQGWITREQLSRDLGVDSAHINTQLFRARKKLAQAFPNMTGLADLLESRPGTIRFNCALAIITKGDQLETIGN